MTWNEFQAAAKRCHDLGRADYLSDRPVESALRQVSNQHVNPGRLTRKEYVAFAYWLYSKGNKQIAEQSATVSKAYANDLGEQSAKAGDKLTF